MKQFTCSYCGKTAERHTGEVNRAIRQGARLYCNKTCFGLAHRKHKTEAQKKEEKRLYDIEYRRKNRAALKAKKAAYFQRTYDPAKAAIQRKGRMAYHVEYCRRPEYRAWKREYDRQYRAKRDYGEFWECFLLTQDIRDECLSRQSDYAIRLGKGTYGKSQKRKRDYARTVCKEPEVGPLGNLERHQRR